jgi:hypothetical protein
VSNPKLILTEGEIKGAAACKLGIPTVALGGVWNFRYSGVSLIEDLASLPLEDYNIYICYDSDRQNNPHVLMAENVLARSLEVVRSKGISILMLPTLTGC